MAFAKKMTDIGCRYLLRTSGISTSSTSCIDLRWRESRNLPANPNRKGILTDGPDYTFLDGKPTPLAQGQRRRMMKQREYAERIVTLCKELDFAEERYRRMQQEETDKREQRLNSKFKPKEHLFLDE